MGLGRPQRAADRGRSFPGRAAQQADRRERAVRQGAARAAPSTRRAASAGAQAGTAARGRSVRAHERKVAEPLLMEQQPGFFSRAFSAMRRHPWRTAFAVPALLLLYVLALIPFTPGIGDLRKAKSATPSVVVSVD